jgi:DNA-binding transcriptional MerR regulator
MEHYSLNDLERLTGIKADTIRVWEKRYDTISPNRTFTNRRWYTGADLKKLINISILIRRGYKISYIARLPLHLLEETVACLAKEYQVSDTLIDSLIVAMTELDESAVNEILLRSVINQGFEKTISSVVFPFLHRVGVMWHTSAVNIGAEHFISNIFRRRLIAAFDNLSPVISSKNKKVLMFLPENEYHELGLLYYAYIVRSLGNQVLYLGQSTPVRAAVEISETWNPQIIFTGSLSVFPFDDPEKYINELIISFPGKKILLAGALAGKAENKEKKGVFACKSEKDLRKLLR